MRKLPARDIALALLTGVATPLVLFALRVGMDVFTGARAERINAFLAPGAHRLRPAFGVMCIEAAVGLAVGAGVGILLARLARGRFGPIWSLFAGTFLTSMLLLPGSVPLFDRLGVLFRQPMIGCALLAAWLGPWLVRRQGVRSAEPGAAR